MLTPLLELDVEVAAPQSAGRAGTGERRCVPITGGRFSGRLEGRVLAGGADWQVLRPDGLADLDARYMLQTSGGARIEVWSRGLRSGPAEVMARLAAGETVDPAAYYMRTAMRFETADPALQWLVHKLAVGLGERRPDLVRLKVFALD
ncbi:DUF3237 domain-containing protein [Ferrovibrio sp.]|uniref:DUF3237 domain-containing protein n=1 Tax=Ferrovibrio sp. TaxID=1917215 RepID=UPI002623DC1D|nr:DUF3237 domain-containing protein [Ferrovibrio sp.]